MNDARLPHRSDDDVPSDMTGPERPCHHVCIVLYDGMDRLGYAGPAAVFRTANARRTQGPSYRVRTASPHGAAVVTADGLALMPDGGLAEAGDPTTVVLPGADGIPELPEHSLAAVGHMLRGARRVAAVSTGVFLLGEAGLLAERRVAAPWRYAEELGRRFPSASVIPGEAVLRDGHVFSCGTDDAAQGLALALVDDDLARADAHRAVGVLDERLPEPKGPSPFDDGIGQDGIGRDSRHPGLRRAQQRVAECPRGDLSTAELARHAGLPERRFSRLFRTEVGLTVQQYVQRVRVRLAAELLVSTDLDLAHIARAVGLAGEPGLTGAFTQVLRTTPGEYRTRPSR